MMRTTAILVVSLAAVQGFSLSPFDKNNLDGITSLHKMIPSGFSESIPDECFIDYASPDGFNEACNALLEQNDLVEDEVTKGISHAFLDFGEFWSQNALVVKSLTVFARLVVFLHITNHGNWHQLLPDELLFQIGFLGLSCHSLLETANIKMEAQKATRENFFMTGKDRLAFRSLFRPAGFTWHQFREVETQCMSWVTMEPGQVILDEAADTTRDNAVFWLYQGEAEVQNHDDSVIHTLTSEHKNTMIGERKLASLQTMGMDSSQNPKSYVAGENGATLLRMDVPKLSRFLKYHDRMSTNFGRLAFASMQNKLQEVKLQSS